MKRRATKTTRIRVLLIAPSVDETPGGMSHVIRSLLEDNDLRQEVEFGYVVSHVEASWRKKLWVLFVALAKTISSMGRYDILHIHSASDQSFFRKSLFVLLARMRGKQVFLHIHGADFQEFYRKLTGLKRRYLTFVLDRSDRILVLSEFWKRQVEEMTRRGRIVTLYNWVDGPGLSRLCEGRGESKQVLFLGRLGERKGIYDLLKAIPLVLEKQGEATFVLAGDGDVSEVKALCRRGGIDTRVQITGWIDGVKKEACLRNANVFVLPSYHEGLPISLLEAMAAGLPVVSTPVGAIPELIREGENGYLVEPGDAGLLAEKIILLLSDPETRQRMSRANLSVVRERFHQGVIFDRLKRLYRGEWPDRQDGIAGDEAES